MTRTMLQTQKLNNLIRQTIIRTVQEVLRDPDYGLELQEWAKKRLSKNPKKFVSFEKIKEKYG